MRIFSLRTAALLLVSVAAVAVVGGAGAGLRTHAASVQVCVLLPDTQSSVRWVQFDAPAFTAAFKKAGVTASINNALNDPTKQKAQAQACLAAGAKVVIETALDNGSAAAIEKLFTSSGGHAIDYDRQVLGGTASVYVTFDGKSVGQAQATGVLAAMKANGTYHGGTVAELWGGPTDQNAFWFKSGNDAVLNPLFAKGPIVKGPQQFVPQWDANNAATIFQQMLVKTNNKIDGVIAANDNIAGAVDRRPEGQGPEADPAERPGRHLSGYPVHPRRLADRNGLQVRADRGECRSRGRRRADQGHEAEGATRSA